MHIAVVEDNQELAEGIANALEDQGHGVDLIHRGDIADSHLKGVDVDLVILDLGMPGKNGFEILNGMRTRKQHIPVLILTARGDLADKVKGLNAGADDYLCKPFAMEELQARVKALLRRGTGSPVVVTMGPLSFDNSSRTAMIGGEAMELPRREVGVLECLMHSNGRLVSKERLLDSVYGTGAEIGESAIEVYVSRLRKRLREHGLDIKTARGLGYRLEITE